MIRKLTFIGGVLASAGMAHAVDISGLFFNTGVDGSHAALGYGAQDLHYNLVAASGGFTEAYAAVPAFNNGGPWIVDDASTAGSRWISPSVDSTGHPLTLDANADGFYTYELKVNLTGYTGAVVNLRWASDNGARLSLNGGGAISTTSGTGYGGWTTVSNITGFNSGWNTFTFDVKNDQQNGGNPTGLRVEFDGATAEAVPEPFTLALGASALGLAIAKRRRAAK